MSLLNNVFKRNTQPYSVVDLPVKDLYDRLIEYYDNDPYQSIQNKGYYTSQWIEAIKPLRTVVNRTTEFYVSRLCQDELVITAESPALEEAIKQFFKWSNIEAKKRPYVRNLALLGDLFLKVVSTKTRVYSEMIEPRHVTSFKVDHRGYVREIRIDVPMRDEKDQPYLYTEYWNKEYFSVWEHPYRDTTPLEELGEPKTFLFLSQLGIDFVPVVWIPFKQVSGKERGESCVAHALSKIDEANRITTRLHQLLWRFNKPTFVVSANAVDKNNRPLPAPVVKGKPSTDDKELDLLANEVLYMPGMSSLSSLIPDIDYNSALAVVKAMEEELEKDLPETRYFSLKDSDLSGKAIQLLLSPAIDRANEARQNLETGLVRLSEMALTIGKYLGLFSNIGTYENGDFEHSLSLGEVFTTSLDDMAQTLKTLTEAGVPLEVAMKLTGFTEEDTQAAVESKLGQEERAMGRFLSEFNNA
jgi:hypothetical protein